MLTYHISSYDTVLIIALKWKRSVLDIKGEVMCGKMDNVTSYQSLSLISIQSRSLHCSHPPKKEIDPTSMVQLEERRLRIFMIVFLPKSKSCTSLRR